MLYYISLYAILRLRRALNCKIIQEKTIVTFKTNDSRSEITKQVQFNSKGIENILSWPWAKEKNTLFAVSRP